ncbi:MAG: bifunctional 4-hydroxy-2-oxoglutarate aldolase/2-dehydro-3-deoxy-phosphogluconate aldolase [Candidatus Limnocylindrales bacterium]
MARFDRLTVWRTMLEIGAVPTFTPLDLPAAHRVVGACQRAGARVVEITNRGAGTYDVFRELLVRAPVDYPTLIIGAGTIYDAPTAALFIGAGAEFIVSPTLSPELARLCNRRKIPYLPGCGSATEISEAEALGAEIVKLFPAAAFDGPALVRGILGPSPRTRLMPTNVDATRAATEAWVQAGVACLGVGPSLISDARQADPDPTALEVQIRTYLDWVRAAREAQDQPAEPPAQPAGRP